MIISPDNFHWFLFDTPLDHRVFDMMERLMKLDPEIERKNRENLFKGKHAPKPQTVESAFKNILSGIRRLMPDFPDPTFEDIPVNTLTKRLNLIQESYDLLFSGAGRFLKHSKIDGIALGDGFFAAEVRLLLKDCLDHRVNGSYQMLTKLAIGDVEFDLANGDLLLNLPEEAGFCLFGERTISLKVATYLICCLAVEPDRASVDEEIRWLKVFLSRYRSSTVRREKSAFWFFTEFWKTESGWNMSQMQKEFGMSETTF